MPLEAQVQAICAFCAMYGVCQVLMSSCGMRGVILPFIMMPPIGVYDFVNYSTDHMDPMHLSFIACQRLHMQS